MYPVITISREVYSGGHTIGEMVANSLGIPFLDKSIIINAAKATGIDIEDVEKHDETGSIFAKYRNGRFTNGLYLGDDQDRIFDAQEQIIIETAKKGPCVIVGRCADAILTKAGIPCLKVYIHADEEYRRDRLGKKYSDKDTDLKKLLKKKDKGRKFYYHYYTDQEMGDSSNYDLCLCSSSLGIEFCADLIIRAAVKANKE